MSAEEYVTAQTGSGPLVNILVAADVSTISSTWTDLRRNAAGCRFDALLAGHPLPHRAEVLDYYTGRFAGDDRVELRVKVTNRVPGPAGRVPALAAPIFANPTCFDRVGFRCPTPPGIGSKAGAKRMGRVARLQR